MVTRTIASELPPCRNCGSTERNYRGDCLQCKREKGREYYRKTHPKKEPKPKKTPEEKRAYHKAYYEANKERHKELGRAWVVRNRERSRSIKRKWSEANPDKQRAAITRWAEANPERMVENRRRWNRENAALKNTYTANRRNAMVGQLSLDIVAKLMEKQNGMCACCGASLAAGFHIDHIQPLSKGGTNTDDNVQLLTPTCNMRKGAKWPIA